MAAKNGHLEVVKFLVGQGKAEVDKATSLDEVPLDVAAEKGHLEVVEFLASQAFDRFFLRVYIDEMAIEVLGRSSGVRTKVGGKG